MNNYTPIDINKIEEKDSGLNTVLLLIATLTALVLAIMLFVLIQRKISRQNQLKLSPTPTFVSPSPTEKIIPREAVPTAIEASSSTVLAPTLSETTITPVSSPTSSLNQ